MRTRTVVALLGIVSAGSALPASPDADTAAGPDGAQAAAVPQAARPQLDAGTSVQLTRYPFLCDYLAAVPDCYCNCLLLACIQTFAHIVSDHPGGSPLIDRIADQLRSPTVGTSRQKATRDSRRMMPGRSA